MSNRLLVLLLVALAPAIAEAAPPPPHEVAEAWVTAAAAGDADALARLSTRTVRVRRADVELACGHRPTASAFAPCLATALGFTPVDHFVGVRRQGSRATARWILQSGCDKGEDMELVVELVRTGGAWRVTAFSVVDHCTDD